MLICVAVAGAVTWRLSKTSVDVRTVTVYVSEDQIFSEPILLDFEKETGIKVKAVYDTEETKSTGAMNRLIAEKDNPRADVYWANEPIRAEVLKQKGISAPYASPAAKNIPDVFKDPDACWTGFSARARVFVVNKNVKDVPRTIRAYTDPRWKDKSVIANPLFGTTTSEIAALFTIWDDARARQFMAEIKNNGAAISTSNGESTDFVAANQYDFSLVDSDDAVNRMRQGKPITMIYPDQGENDIGCFIVPNAAVLIKGAPHPDTAQKLIDYLLSGETEQKLAFADCAQIPLNPGVPMPPELKAIKDIKVMEVDYAEVAAKMIEIQPFLKEWVER
ncbi:MAG: extracellular solute-binding protein [Deltaproteobacteria bacterium]|nr:extracellular solute-binding protein [Deltaproteobacteria bacterium]